MFRRNTSPQTPTSPPAQRAAVSPDASISSDQQTAPLDAPTNQEHEASASGSRTRLVETFGIAALVLGFLTSVWPLVGYITIALCFSLMVVYFARRRGDALVVAMALLVFWMPFYMTFTRLNVSPQEVGVYGVFLVGALLSPLGVRGWVARVYSSVPLLPGFALVLFALACLQAAARSAATNPVAVFYALRMILLYPVLLGCLVAYTVRSRDCLRVLVQAFVGGAICFASYALLLRIARVPFVNGAVQGRLGSEASFLSLYHPNNLGLYLTLGLLFTPAIIVQAWISRSAQSVKLFGVVTGAALMAEALWLTYSRGALVALAVGGGVIVLFWIVASRFRWLLLGACALAAGAVAIFLIHDPARLGRYAALFDPRRLATDNNVLFRLPLYARAFQDATSHALTGLGLARFSQGTTSPFSPHDTYLDLWVSIGIIGLLAFIALVVLGLVFAWRGARRDLRRGNWLEAFYLVGVIAAIVAFSIQAFVEEFDQQPRIAAALWVLALMGIVAGARLAPRHPGAASTPRNDTDETPPSLGASPRSQPQESSTARWAKPDGEGVWDVDTSLLPVPQQQHAWELDTHPLTSRHDIWELDTSPLAVPPQPPIEAVETAPLAPPAPEIEDAETHPLTPPAVWDVDTHTLTPPQQRSSAAPVAPGASAPTADHRPGSGDASFPPSSGSPGDSTAKRRAVRTSEALLQRAPTSYVWNQLYSLWIFAASFVLSIVLTRGLGRVEYGVYAVLVTAVNTVTLVVALGLEDVAAVFVPRVLASEGSSGASSLIRRLIGLRLLPMVAIAGLLAAGWQIFAPNLRALGIAHDIIADPGTSAAWLRILLLAAYFVGNGVVMLQGAVFTSMLRSRATLIIGGLSQGLDLALLIVMLRLGYGIDGIFAVLAGVAWLTAIAYSITLWPLLHARREKPLPARREMRRLMLSAWLTNVTDGALGKQMDIIIMSIIAVGFVSIAYYNLAYQLGSIVGVLLIAGLGGVGMAAMSAAFSAGGPVRLASWWRASLMLQILFSVPLQLLCFALAEQIVGVLYGAQYLGAVPLLRIFLGFSIFGRLLGGGASQSALYVVGRQRRVLFVRWVGLVLNLVLDIVLIVQYGATGAFIATGFSQLIVGLIEYLLLRRSVPTRYPARFALRIVSGAGVGALVVAWLALPGMGGLALSGVLFAVIVLLSLRLIQPSEIEDLSAIVLANPRLRRLFSAISWRLPRRPPIQTPAPTQTPAPVAEEALTQPVPARSGRR